MYDEYNIIQLYYNIIYTKRPYIIYYIRTTISWYIEVGIKTCTPGGEHKKYTQSDTIRYLFVSLVSQWRIYRYR